MTKRSKPKPPLLTPDEFEVLADVAKVRKNSRTREAARHVLCNGATQVSAAELSGTAQPAVSVALRKLRKVQDQIKGIENALR